ncbi:ThuA domain-containing protein [Niabella hibiscisoli]|uniref:ThuA domain-containing protein n=1 Tax=Niabella hibiscisoli TaxID=1825928 RepID=UPI001F0F0497|nr:ThuA domain-containing protein [Niabella hibiscisoli]MCH5719645.1 ThuA domain-containing protein [Niabella hibiscisoli]
MKRVFFTILISWIACISLNAALPHPPAKTKVLVLTERGGGHEGFVAAALDWLKAFADKNKLELKVINHPREIEHDSLACYRLFIQLNYPPYNWTPKTMAAFERYIDQGLGSWIGFHHATLLGEFDGYPIWNWFSDFMGGIRFKSYIAKKATANVWVEAAGHPVMKSLPRLFSIPDDEWYTFDKNPRTNVNVLATVDESSYQPASDVKMGDHPVIWSNSKKKAKNVYFLIGHSASLVATPAFTQMFANAIKWGLKK